MPPETAEREEDPVPPHPYFPVEESGRYEDCDGAVEFSEDRRRNAGEVRITVVHRERNGLLDWGAFRETVEQVCQGQDRELLGAQPLEIRPKDCGVVPVVPEVAIAEPVHHENRRHSSRQRKRQRQ